ncbi:MAG: glycosyltransferase family 2 protein [Terriglobia bacterium]
MHRVVDIILPTHRRPHTVGYSIQSVLRQTYPSFHLHVVGDGCDSNTESIVRSFVDPRVHFYPFRKGKGFGYVHRNVVLRQTSGEYVAYIADDDLWFPDHLERGVAALEDRHLGLIAFRACHVRAPDKVDPHFFAFDWQVGFLSNFLRNWFTGMAEYIHRRKVFEQVGYWDDTLSRFGDREFYNRLRASSAPSAYLDCMTVLRFYAQEWDEHYSSLEEPPQKRYLANLLDPRWCEAIRNLGNIGARGFPARQQQWRDFFVYAVRSGPKFLRFWCEELATYLHTQERQNVTGS